MSRSPESPDRRRSGARPVGTAAAIAAMLLGGAATAEAGVARLVPDGDSYDRGPTTVRIATADAAGRRRTLGPFRLADRPGGILAAPDGLHVALLPNDQGFGPLWIAPLDGGPPVSMALPPGVVTFGDLSQGSWSEDGGSFVLGDVLWLDPTVDPDDADGARPGQSRWTSLRCAVATASCVELPGPGGMVAPVAGGAVVGSSYLSLFPIAFLFEGAGDEPLPEWERATSDRGRRLTGVAQDVRTASTHVEGTAAPHVVEQQVRPAAKGLTVTLGARSGPAGALLTQTTIRYRLDRRAGKVRLRGRESPARFVTVAPDGRVTRRPVATLTVPRRERLGIGRIVARDVRTLTFAPAVGTPDGGWVGTGVLGAGGLNGTSVATMTADGRARFVRVRGRVATPQALVSAARGLPRRWRTARGPLEVVGFERSTGRVIVGVSVETRDDVGSSRGVALRVRLDGRGRPTVVAGGAETAW